MTSATDRFALEHAANLSAHLYGSRVRLLLGTAMVLAGVSLLLALLSDISLLAALLPLAGILGLLWQTSSSPLLMAPVVLMVTALVVTLSPLFTTVHPFTFAVALIGLSVAMAGLVSIGQGALTHYTCTHPVPSAGRSRPLP